MTVLVAAGLEEAVGVVAVAGFILHETGRR